MLKCPVYFLYICMFIRFVKSAGPGGAPDPAPFFAVMSAADGEGFQYVTSSSRSDARDRSVPRPSSVYMCSCRYTKTSRV